MSRRVVLTDVTAMSGTDVCVAGIDLDFHDTVRLWRPQPNLSVIRKFGGLPPGTVIELDAKSNLSATAPHVEDCTWDPGSLRVVGRMRQQEIAALLTPRAWTSLETAFGEYAVRAGHGRGNAAWPAGAGDRSLTTLRVRYVRAKLDQRGKLRIDLMDMDESRWFSVPFQDLIVRQHQANCADCADDLLNNVQREFDGNGVLVRVGLTRPFTPDENTEPVCWLQVTNVFARERVHFSDAPPARQTAEATGLATAVRTA